MISSIPRQPLLFDKPSVQDGVIQSARADHKSDSELLGNAIVDQNYQRDATVTNRENTPDADFAQFVIDAHARGTYAKSGRPSRTHLGIVFSV